MKLLYTDVSQDMTLLLAKEAQSYADAGRRVFYIAPNSLSFEKERRVLEVLPNHASFRITVTRFTQMARYFVLNSAPNQKSIDNVGLAMLFFQVLSHFSDEDLRVYGRLRKDMSFIQQLVDLYNELKTAHLTVLDLHHLEDDKAADLIQIFAAVTDLLQQHRIENHSKLAFFMDQIVAGNLDKELSDTVLVVDGFTRFSAEEEYLIHLLSEKCHEIVIGTYASKKAYQSNFIQGNIYQASVEFLRALALRYATTPMYIEHPVKQISDFAQLSKYWESQHDFSQLEGKWQPQHSDSVQIWQMNHQKDEVEQAATYIRQLLAEGVRYKEILVLLGDAEGYKLHVGQIFEKYDIPYYFGKAESMSHHPLVHFIESLERIKRYNYRAEDVLNLLKSSLYSHFSEMEIDRFSQYVIYAVIKGRSRFTKAFTADNAGKYDIEELNALRERIIAPIDTFLSSRPQKGQHLLQKLKNFLEAVQLPKNMEKMATGVQEVELEQHEQVWKVFSDLLLQMEELFGQEKLSVDDFLALLCSGMLAAQYRTVPATVDVVDVKSYDLVEPHTNKYVIALGMTRSHFPKIAQNSGLLTDQERALVNERTGEFSAFEISTRENVKKNHFTALSLLNAASQQLILSYPHIANESEEDISVYLKEWQQLGVMLADKSHSKLEAKSEKIGNYKSVLSTVIALNQATLDRELTKEEQTFWSVATRYVRKRLQQEGVLIPHISDDVQTTKVSDEVMAVRFPAEKPIRLSTSALTTFYNNQYLYFLNVVLGLQALETITPDSRHHGLYLHRIFELTMQDDGRDFDTRLESAIQETRQENTYSLLYNQDDEGRFSQEVLDDIARSTASILRDNAAIQVASQEERFALELQNVIQINGVIDRVDRLADGSFGVVDYKSGTNQFDIQKFYNGLHSQLVTYLRALQSQYNIGTEQIFGAMYLHMQEPKINLKTVKNFDELSQKASSELVYKGLFAEQEKQYLANGAYHLNQSVFDAAEIDTLLAYNEKLFLDAAETIRKGKFLINPYTADGRSVQGEQLKNITHFEADRHMKYARSLLKLPTRGKKEAFLALMNEKLSETKE